jgi:hypothetical protein
MMREAVRRLVPAVLAAVVLTGCSSESDGGGAADEPTAVGSAEAGADKTADGTADKAADKAAAKGGTVGGSGSACTLPISFDLAADWKPKAVTVDPDSEFGDLLVQGPVTLACEIDAKPAGNIGFLRVWAGDASNSTARQVLEAFIADEEDAEKITYKETKAGALTATEADYTVTSELLDESKTESAFAVTTPDGPVVVHLGGMDTQEHEEMLPAYELAKKSVRLG